MGKWNCILDLDHRPHCAVVAVDCQLSVAQNCYKTKFDCSTLFTPSQLAQLSFHDTNVKLQYNDWNGQEANPKNVSNIMFCFSQLLCVSQQNKYSINPQTEKIRNQIQNLSPKKLFFPSYLEKRFSVSTMLPFSNLVFQHYSDHHSIKS